MEFLSARSRRAFPEQHPIRAQRLPPTPEFCKSLKNYTNMQEIQM
jgi:hypothetical protein